MHVSLHQYRGVDSVETVPSEASESVNTTATTYFNIADPIDVYLRQYRANDVDKETGTESEENGDESSYFDSDDLAVTDWKRIEHHGSTVFRRTIVFDDVVALSVPKEYLETNGLPGTTVQLRMSSGATKHVTNAAIVEVDDGS